MVFLLQRPPAPREVTEAPRFSNDGGWLLRFFDSAFFCEWIAVTYLYRHEHGGVRDYLCNRMYNLPVSGIEDYLFQLCHMAVQKPSPSLEKYIIDACSKSLRLSLKVYWFLQAENEDIGDDEDIRNLQEICQTAAQEGDWAPLICPNPPTCMLSGRERMMRLVSSASKRLLPLSASGAVNRPLHLSASTGNPGIVEESGSEVGNGSTAVLESEHSMKLLRKLMPGPKVQQMREAFFRKFTKEEGCDEEGGGDRVVVAGSLELMGGIEGPKLKENLFRYFRRKEGEKGEGEGDETEEEEGYRKDSFYAKYFRKGKDGCLEEGEEGEEGGVSIEGGKSKEMFFPKMFWKGHNEKWVEGEESEEKSKGVTEDMPLADSLFKRMWGEKKGGEEVEGEDVGSVSLLERGRMKSWRMDEEGFFRKLFGGKGDDLAPEESKLIGELRAVVEAHGGIEGDEKSFFWGILGHRGGEVKALRGEKLTEELEGPERQNSFLGKLFMGRPEEPQEGGEGTEDLNASDGYFRRFIRGRGEEMEKGEASEKGENRGKVNCGVVEGGEGDALIGDHTEASDGLSGKSVGGQVSGGGSRDIGGISESPKVEEDKAVEEMFERSISGSAARMNNEPPPINERKSLRKRLFGSKDGTEKAVGERSTSSGSAHVSESVDVVGGVGGEGVGVLERTISGRGEKGMGEDSLTSENRSLSFQLRKLRSSIANAAGAAVSLTHQGSGGDDSSLRPPLTPTKKKGEECGSSDRVSTEVSVVEKGTVVRLGTGEEAIVDKVGERTSGEEPTASSSEPGFLRKLNPFRVGGSGSINLTVSLDENVTGEGSASKPSLPSKGPPTPKGPLTPPRKDRISSIEILASSPSQIGSIGSSSSFLRKLWREKGEDDEKKVGDGKELSDYVPFVDPPAPQTAVPSQKSEGIGGGRLSFIGNPLRSATQLVVGPEKTKKDITGNEISGPKAPVQLAGTETLLNSTGANGGNVPTPSTPPSKKVIVGLLPRVRPFSSHSVEPPSPTQILSNSLSGVDSVSGISQSSRSSPAGSTLGLGFGRNLGSGFGQSIRLGGAGGGRGGGEGEGGESGTGFNRVVRPGMPMKVSKPAAVVPEPEEDGHGHSTDFPSPRKAYQGSASVHSSILNFQFTPPTKAHQFSASGHPTVQNSQSRSTTASVVGAGSGRDVGLTSNSGQSNIPFKIPKPAAVVPEPEEYISGVHVNRSEHERLDGGGDECGDSQDKALSDSWLGDSKDLMCMPSPVKPPLPRYPAFKIRQGTFHASLDFVKALSDISSGLVDVFPLSDRQKALKESLAELNAHLEAGSAHGGVCFPMGKQVTRVMHILDDETVLLNSRDRVPFMVFLEVLRCDSMSSRKDEGEGVLVKRAKGGIPLANGDAKLPRPPPWALHMWNSQGKIGGEGLGLKTGQEKKAWEGETVKVVDTSLVVRKGRGKKMSGRRRKEELVEVRETSEAHRLNDGEEDNDAKSDVNSINEVDSSERSLEGISGGETERVQEGNCRCDEREGMVGGEEKACCRKRADSGVCLAENTVLSTSKGGTGELCGDIGEAGSEREEEKEETMSETSGSDGSDSSGEWEETSSRECDEWVTVKLVAVPGLMMEDVAAMTEKGLDKHRRVPSGIAMEHVLAEAAEGKTPEGLLVSSNLDASQQEGKALHPMGELWSDRCSRIRKASKFGTSPDWDLKSMIVKSGDDCRQEHLAVQLMSHFQDIFTEADLPLWLRPYEVIVTSSSTALIETIPDALSIHSLKSRNPNVTGLREYFNLKYKDNSKEFQSAQKRFVESMAGYSIFCYLMQVKDRHNGNIMLDKDGRIIHIDFGFMLSNSPGGVNFENAPFKLTREFLEVMDSDAEGTPSEPFDYFKVLCIQGFLTCRKHAERILLLVEMMQHSGCKCFKAGPRTIHNLRKRFHLTLTEEQCVSLVLELITNSLDAWRTRQYDYYQRVLNGIL